MFVLFLALHHFAPLYLLLCVAPLLSTNRLVALAAHMFLFCSLHYTSGFNGFAAFLSGPFFALFRPR